MQDTLNKYRKTDDRVEKKTSSEEASRDLTISNTDLHDDSDRDNHEVKQSENSMNARTKAQPYTLQATPAFGKANEYQIYCRYALEDCEWKLEIKYPIASITICKGLPD